MSWSNDDERVVGQALLAARRKLQSDDGKKPIGSDIVFQVIREIVDIERRMRVRAASPKQARGWLLDCVYSDDDIGRSERAEAAKQREIDIAAGDDPYMVLGYTPIVTPDELKMYDAVKLVFRDSMIGKNQPRDWKILERLCQGGLQWVGWRQRGDADQAIAKDFHISRQRVAQLKRMQCGSIWVGVSRLMPAAAGGKIWRDAA